MLAVLALVALSATDPVPALFCVASEANGALSLSDLREALQARLDLPGVDVVLCSDAPADAVRWRLDVEPQQPGDLLVRLDGQGLAQVQPVQRHGLGPERLAQVVALVAAEAVRPALELAGVPRPATASDTEDVIGALEAEPTPPPPVDGGVRPYVQLEPFMLLAGTRLKPAAGLGGGLELRRLGVELRLVAQPLSTSPRAMLQGSIADVTLAVGWSLRPVRVALGLVGRATFVRHHRVAGETEGPWDVVTSAGVTLGTDMALWHAGTWEVALVGGLALWPRPAALRVGGRTAHEAPYVEVTLGPAIRWRSSSRL